MWDKITLSAVCIIFLESFQPTCYLVTLYVGLCQGYDASFGLFSLNGVTKKKTTTMVSLFLRYRCQVTKFELW